MSKEQYGPHISRIKMVILTKPGEPNHTRYSFARLNRRSNEHIITGMKKRLMESELAKVAQVLQFWDIQSGNLLEEHKS